MHNNCVCESLSRVQLFAIPWTAARQAPLSMKFSRQEYWSGLPVPAPEDLPDSGIEPGSPALQVSCALNHPETIPARTGPWRNCLPWNHSLVPKMLGPGSSDFEENVCAHLHLEERPFKFLILKPTAPGFFWILNGLRVEHTSRRVRGRLAPWMPMPASGQEPWG